jgi:hypothetical protein
MNELDDDLLVEKVDINQTTNPTENLSEIGSGNYSQEDIDNFKQGPLPETNFQFDGVSGNVPFSPATMRDANADINIKMSAVPMSPGALRRRTFMNRTFSKLDKGSVRGSIMSLTSAAVGGGVLSLPYVFALSGWAAGIFLVFLGCFAGIWSN